MFLQKVDGHFRQPDNSDTDISSEFSFAERTSDARTLVRLTPEGIKVISQHYPPVKNANDLDVLPEKLRGEAEIGFSPLFDPALIDACCQRGIFPLTLCLGQGVRVFAPKLHTNRALCALVSNPGERNAIKGFPFCEAEDGIFKPEHLSVSKKFLRCADDTTRNPTFKIFFNRKEDIVDLFTLIQHQHGEDWMCSSLRICLFFMFLNPQQFATKIIVTAIRRHKYNGSSDEKCSYANEGDLVAGEVGFLVGDIYCSATGAYCVSGGGSLQLALTGIIMQKAGCRIWDLGMMMDYKRDLQCIPVSRKKWLGIVTARRKLPNSEVLSYLSNFSNGQPVSTFFLLGGAEEIANENSKSQIKKRQKKAFAKEKKQRRTP